MWIIRTVLILLLLIMAVSFFAYNSGPDQKVSVYLQPLFANRTNVPLGTVVLWAFAAGAGLSFLFFVTVYVRLSVQGHASRKRIRSLEGEVTILRNRPIEESAELLKGADRKKDEQQSPFAEN
jgi:uncharacterized membrane protein YciS (DUF1049 family)